MATPLRDEAKGEKKGGMLEAFVSGVPSAQPPAVPSGLEGYSQLPPAGREFLERVLRSQLLQPAALRHFLDESAERLAEIDGPEAAGYVLTRAGLLTDYQLDRLLAGTTHGLVLGNYRILRRLGAGSMAVVFLAEHFLMKRRVAVKVLPVDEDCPAAIKDRFYGEMHVLADLHHPNIVLAYDAGELPPAGPRMPALAYLVMELIDGGDLEQYLVDHGLTTVEQTCDWVRQAACGLQEAHDHHLIHRDIKPSNLLLTRQGQVKLVDFGLARQFCSSLTSPRVLLGSVEFMAPEQSRDPSTVNAQADIYGLGATLFWLLTGELPFPQKPTLAAALRALQQEPPRRLRALRRDAPEELGALVDQMLDRDPARRPATPLAVMTALARFCTPGVTAWPSDPAAGPSGPAVRPAFAGGFLDRVRRALVVDSDETFCQQVGRCLEPLGCSCDYTDDPVTALGAVRERPYDLVVVDLHLPATNGLELCRRLRERPQAANQRHLLLLNRSDAGLSAEVLAGGADDTLTRPFDPEQLGARALAAFQVKEALDRYEQLTRHLQVTNRQLESSLTARSGDVREAQDALLFGMAKMAESRDGETAGHLRRLQRFAVVLAERVADDPLWSGTVDGTFLEQLARCVPLHDIGKIGLPDQVLSKPGALDPQERALMETHTVIGATILEALGKEHGGALTFLGTARAIVRHHHERYDGRGYPDRLAGDDIPAAPRLVALADVYDALRRKRFHKPALPHAEAARFILEGSGGQFDPALLRAFATCQDQFERIFRDIRE